MSADQAPSQSDTLVEAALKILNQPDPWVKAMWTQDVVKMWRSGQLCDVHHQASGGDSPPSGAYTCPAPDRPARADDKVQLVAPAQVGKLGKAGTLASRQAIVHSLTHIESWAVDLAWDVIARWGTDPRWAPHLPRQFYDDFVLVADDESRHFLALEARLKAMGSHYGALTAHDGLWESASATSYSLAARLSVEHCVHEARGLDVLPSTIEKFRRSGDTETAMLLEGTIYPEEVTHCAAGVRWLTHLHAVALQGTQGAGDSAGGQDSDVSGELPVQGVQLEEWMVEARQYSTVQAWFHALVRATFKGSTKPPFNDMARAQAGFDPSWYTPLCAGS